MSLIFNGILPPEIENYIFQFVDLSYEKDYQEYLSKCKNIVIKNEILKADIRINNNYFNPPDLFGRILVNPGKVIENVNTLTNNELIKKAHIYHLEEISHTNYQDWFYHKLENKMCIKQNEKFYFINSYFINFSDDYNKDCLMKNLVWDWVNFNIKNPKTYLLEKKILLDFL